MPAVNGLSTRCYVQYRPDFYAARNEIDRMGPLEKVWERGSPSNNRGDYARLYCLLANIQALEQAGLPGAFAELGVYRGTTAKILHEAAPKRDLYLFDTFEGFPELQASQDPLHMPGGVYPCSLNEVRDFVGSRANITYCKGIFPDTAAMVPSGTLFALVHLDCDLYVPMREALRFFYPRMTPGGLLVIHDYWSGCWPGVAQAVDEFLDDKPEGIVRIPDKSGTAVLVRQRQAGRQL